MLALPLAASAQYASVNNAYISDDGVTLTVTTDMTISGCLNQNVQVIVYYYFSDGTPLTDYNNQYNTADGSVSAVTTVKPMYQSTDFTGLEINIPFSELHLKAGMRHNIRFQVRAHAYGRFIDNDSNIYDITVTI